MKLTNNHNIPQIIIRAMGEAYPPKLGRIAVTSLIDSPLIRYLKIKHWDELEEDASSKLWALLGQSAHHILEKGKAHTDLTEEKLKISVFDMDIVGRSDVIQDDEIIDFKITSVWSFLLGDKIEWGKQLNIYRYMAKICLKRDIKKAWIYSILRDWQESKKYTQPDYPAIPFHQTEITLAPLEFVQKYIEERVTLHKIADEFINSEMPPNEIWCTDAEKWTRPTTYAVKGVGNKRALRVLDTYEQAQAWMEEKHNQGKKGVKLEIETRPGVDARCENYCVCSKVCPIRG